METPTKLQKKKDGIVERACNEINGFRELFEELDDQVRLSGLSSGTLVNYSRKLALLSLPFGKLPQDITDKEPFAGPEQVVEYLGRYTHKVAISNHRLLNIDESNVHGLLSTAKRPELRELQKAFGIYVPLVKEKKDWKQICREHLQ